MKTLISKNSKILWSLLKWKSKVTQSCLTPCDPMDRSLPSFSVHEIFKARVLEWVASSFSRGSSWPRDRTQVSHTVGRCFALCTTFPGGSDDKEFACNSGDLGSIPGLERSPGEVNDYPVQYSRLENPMERRASWRDPWRDGLQSMGQKESDMTERTVARVDINITCKASCMLTDNNGSLININSIPYYLVLICENVCCCC